MHSGEKSRDISFLNWHNCSIKNRHTTASGIHRYLVIKIFYTRRWSMTRLVIAGRESSFSYPGYEVLWATCRSKNEKKDASATLPGKYWHVLRFIFR